MKITIHESGEKKWPWVAAFAITALAFAALGYLYYRSEVDYLTKQAHDQLHAVALLKANQIHHWRRERIAGLRVLVGSPFFSRGLQELVNNPDSPQLRSDVTERLDLIRRSYGYQDAIVLNRKMQIVLSLKQDPHVLDPHARRTIEDALENNRIAFGDFYRCSICLGVHIDVAAPISGSSGDPFSVIVFRIDPSQDLYPLIQSWPGASATAETLLVRKEGEHVLFLNELRHRIGTALKLAIPMTETDVAAVQGLRDRRHRFIEAKDYRGMAVLADANPIEDTPWVMVAKVDKDELLSALKYRSALVGLFIVILIALCGAGISFLFVRRQKTIYKDLYESERRASEIKEEFLITLESIVDAVVTTDTRGYIKYMNPVAELLTEWNESEAINRPITEVFHVLDERTGLPVKDPVTQVLEKGSMVRLGNETVLVSRHGTQRPIADSGAPIQDENGNVIGVVMVFRDQTEYRATQKALRESKELAELYLDLSAEIVLSLNPEGKVVMINSSGCRLLGYERDELVGKDWFETCLDESERNAARDVFIKLMLGESEVISSFENAVVTKDKLKKVILWHSSVLKNDQGQPIAMLSSGEDITERKRAEVDLRQARQDWEDIFQAITHPTIIIDKRHNILNANKAIKEATGKTVDELTRTKCYEIFHNAAEPPYNCPATALIRSGAATTIEMEMEALGGYFLVSCTPVLDHEGKITKIIHIATDITDRKRMEEEREALRAQLVQAQKMEAVGTLAGGLAHDFNNILQVTLGYAELLLMDKAFPEAYRTHINMISESSKRGSDLARRLLVFSRRTKVELKPMNLNECVWETRKILERTIPKMISIELFLQEDLPPISGNRTELEQVIVNLAINARDAMPEGGRLTLETKEIFLDEEYARTHFDCKPGKHVLLLVSDTGVGMEKETLDRIYEPFFTTKESGKGTGLGLSVVYGIIKQHGARIGCYSEPGNGTTFKIYFPITEVSLKEALQEDGLVMGGTETILLVDDEVAIRDLGNRLLSNAGYEVILASNGKEAIDIYKKHQDKIALVILDLIMPEMGGLQCMKELLAINPSLRIIVTSGHSANGVSQEAMRCGAKDFIQKPFELRRVLRQVRAVLDTPAH